MAKKKTRSKAPAKRYAPHTCDCVYNHRITSAYDEALAARGNDGAHFEEYFEALQHNETFMSMVEGLGDEEVRECILTDAVRFGYEAGKRMAEVHSLERMVGYGEETQSK